MKYNHLFTSLVVSASVMLGACSSQANYTGGADVERSIVTMARLAHPVMAEADSSATLSDASIANLDNFSETNNVGYGDTVMFDQGDDVEAPRLEALRKYFLAKGVVVGENNAVFGALPTDGSVIVYIERYVVSAPDCQRWSEGSASNPNNAPGQPFGCTSQSNLAAMVANPRDLITGNRSGAISSKTVDAVTTYRNSTKDGGKN